MSHDTMQAQADALRAALTDAAALLRVYTSPSGRDGPNASTAGQARATITALGEAVATVSVFVATERHHKRLYDAAIAGRDDFNRQLAGAQIEIQNLKVANAALATELNAMRDELEAEYQRQAGADL